MPKKNTMVPMPTGRAGGMLGKLIGLCVVLALVVIVVKHPSDAAGWLRELIGFGSDVIDGIVSFIRQLAA